MHSQGQYCYWVYVVGSISGTLYIGVTGNLELRVRQHKEHLSRGFTAKYDVDRLLYYEKYREVKSAIKREKQLKGWRREKKIALIEKMNLQCKDLSRGWYDKPARESFDWRL